MPRPPEPIFLGRQTYRRRRLIDAMRLLPILGIGAFVVPVLGAEGGGRSTAFAGLYIFAAWLVLIIAAAVLTRTLGRDPGGVAADPLEPAGPPEPPDLSGE
jgi:hypothetical protein